MTGEKLSFDVLIFSTGYVAVRGSHHVNVYHSSDSVPLLIRMITLYISEAFIRRSKNIMSRQKDLRRTLELQFPASRIFA